MPLPLKILAAIALLAILGWLVWQAALAADEQRKRWPWDDIQ